MQIQSIRIFGLVASTLFALWCLTQSLQLLPGTSFITILQPSIVNQYNLSQVGQLLIALTVLIMPIAILAS